MGVDALEARLLNGDDVGNLQMGLRVNALKALTAFNIGHTAHPNVIESTDPISIVAESFADVGSGLLVKPPLLNFRCSLLQFGNAGEPARFLDC